MIAAGVEGLSKRDRALAALDDKSLANYLDDFVGRRRAVAAKRINDFIGSFSVSV